MSMLWPLSAPAAGERGHESRGDTNAAMAVPDGTVMNISLVTMTVVDIPLAGTVVGVEPVESRADDFGRRRGQPHDGDRHREGKAHDEHDHSQLPERWH
jgi:hypothetical protein